jgi:ketosteroid isomerase-like protein
MRAYSELIALVLTATSITNVAAAAPRTATAASDASPQARDAAATVAAFHQALNDGNLKAAADLLVSDALIYESGAVDRSREEYVSHHLPADAAFAKAVPRTLTSQSAHASGNLAWIASQARTRGNYKGRAIESASTETMVLRREGAQWRIVHIHWSSAK